MTLARLKDKMLYQLQGCVPPRKRASIDLDTPHKRVVRSDDGPPSTASVYKDFVILSAKLEQTRLKRWPSDWLERSINETAPDLLPGDVA